MSAIGKTIHVKGEVRSAEDLTIEGHVEGPVMCEDFSVTFAPTAEFTGDVIARDIIVSGRTSGQLIATEVVDVRAEARVTGTVLAPRFILNDAAHFVGRVEPQHLDAALRVHRFQQRKRDAV